MSPAEKIMAWKNEGRIHCSPAEAASVLHCDPVALRIGCKQGISNLEWFASGRNVRIMISSLERVLGMAEHPGRARWLE